ncbi:MAG: amidohydrolase family protein [Salinirussus sp.]
MSQSVRSSDILQEHTVVDVDVHPSYRDRVIVEKVAERLDSPYDMQFGDPTSVDASYPTDAFPKGVPGKVDVTGRLVDVEEELLKPHGEAGIDYAILNILAQIDALPETERTLQEMRAYNDVLLEHYLEDHDNLFGLARVTTRDVEAAVDEIDRVRGEDSFVGVLIVHGSSEPRLGHETYDPIYDAADAADFPVVFHTGAANHVLHPKFPLPSWDFEKFLPIHTLSHPFAHLVTVASLMTNGTPAKFPDLDFVFLEAGIAWILTAMYRLNRDYGQRRWDAPLLEQPPESYIRDQFYFGTQPLDEPNNRGHLTQIVDMVGPESLMFSTDHPHFDFDNPGAVVDEAFGHLEESDLERVLSGNARDVFGVPA